LILLRPTRTITIRPPADGRAWIIHAPIGSTVDGFHMPGTFPENYAGTHWPARLLALQALAWLAWLPGCNPNAGGTTTWNNPFAPAPSATSSPYGPQRLGEMRRQADQQYQLALEQQRRLAELEAMQHQSDQQLAQMREQERLAKLRAFQDEEQREALTTQRAQEFLGRYDELGQRARSLDQTNQDLNAQVARIQQRAQLMEDQNQLLRQRLEDTSRQLSAALEANKQSEQRVQTLMASTQRRSGATITANNSYRRNLTAVTVAGLSIRQDGELVRIELASDRLFDPETANFRPDAAAEIEQVANVILSHYPRQVVGVEAHTDGTPTNTSLWRNAHQLTAAQAMAVFEQLSHRHRLLPQQMFVLGHGANFALASNATDVGRARNRRVEIVVYPDTVGQR
jgi:flagellar motor protein MotB